MRTVAAAAALGAALTISLTGCAATGKQTGAAPAGGHDAAAVTRVEHLVATVVGGARASRPAAPHTAVHTFRAFTSAGAPAVPVAGTVSGSCWTGSISTPVPDAYRCMSGNQILDPCFVPAGVAHPAAALCLSGPTASATRLTLTGALPAGSPLTTAKRPWSLRLANGARCEISTGTVAVVGGRSYPYFCGRAGFASLPEAAGASFDTVDFVAADAVRPLTVRVTDVWSA